MLSPNTLERVSGSYRNGYYAGYRNEPKNTPDNGIVQINNDTIGGTIRPFADYDYNKGYEAGANDAYWEKKRAAK